MVETLIISKRKIKSPERNAQGGATIAISNQTKELYLKGSKSKSSFQSTILNDVPERLTHRIENLDIQQQQQQYHDFRNFEKPQHASELAFIVQQIPKTDVGHSKTVTNAATRPLKVLQNRESYLTTLLEVNHIKTVYHIHCALFLLYLVNSIIHDYFVKGSITFGLDTIKSGFAKIHHVLGVWLLQTAFVCSIYYALRGWSTIRSKLVERKTLQCVWSLCWLGAYITSQVIFIYIPTRICLKWDLPFGTAFALLMESVRMSMKMHGFVRSICGRVLQGKLKTDGDDTSALCAGIPPFQKYLYYLFAPTLLYRDNYPRTSVIRWKFAAARFLEVIAIVFFFSYIYERRMKEHFGNFGKEEYSAESIINKLFAMVMPSVTLTVCGFYMVLHAWLNFTAELLRFGDRMFYRDWWTSSDFAGYMRNWNVVVHDWLYEYVYRDFYAHIFRGSKLAATLAVLIISGLFHEYITSYALQVFFPVMLVLFIAFGSVLFYISRALSKNSGKIIFCFIFMLLNCLTFSIYSMEYFTSRNCPKETYQQSSSDWWVPHLWSCYMK